MQDPTQASVSGWRNWREPAARELGKAVQPETNDTKSQGQHPAWEEWSENNHCPNCEVIGTLEASERQSLGINASFMEPDGVTGTADWKQSANQSVLRRTFWL